MIIIPILTFFLGSTLVYILFTLKIRSIREYQEKILHETGREQEKLIQTTQFTIKEKEIELLASLKIEEETKKFKLYRLESDLLRQQEEILSKLKKIEKKEQSLNEKEKELHIHEKKIYELSGLTEAEVKDILFKKFENEVYEESLEHLKKIEMEYKEKADSLAKQILETAIQRISLPSLNSIITTGVPIDDEEIKAKVVGKEGRNIRTFEQLTGTTLLMDESPHSIIISSFDPIRREIASRTLKILVAEGKIYPSRIEEIFESMRSKVDEIICQKGEEGAAIAGVFGLHSELIKLLGKLHFRYSLGQNLLEHSIEVSYFLGLIADELGLNSSNARRIGLLHDIGKAIEEHHGKSHAIVGMEFAKRCGEKEAVYNGIGCHHFEIEPITLEGSLCNVADGLSAFRPGSRQERLDTYVKRMKELETIASGIAGIEKVFALQMGKEIRVIVHPDWNNDLELNQIARSVKEKVLELSPTGGKVKLTLCCEKKLIEMI